MNDRGVSETLGFVLVFALVVGTVGMVYATGVTGLHDTQNAEKVNNVERAFDVLADNLDDLHRTGTRSRATEIKLAGGSLDVDDPVTFKVRAEDAADENINMSVPAVRAEPVIYEDDGGTDIVYVSGAVLRSDPGGAVMLSEPGWINGTERSVIPLVDTDRGGVGVAGDGTVLIVAEAGSRNVRVFEPEVGDTAVVNVTVTSPRASVWKSFMEDKGYTAIDSDASDGSVTYQFETKAVYVPRTSVDVSFDR